MFHVSHKGLNSSPRGVHSSVIMSHGSPSPGELLSLCQKLQPVPNKPMQGIGEEGILHANLQPLHVVFWTLVCPALLLAGTS